MCHLLRVYCMCQESRLTLVCVTCYEVSHYTLFCASYFQILSTVYYSHKIASLCSLFKVSVIISHRCKFYHSAVCLATGPQHLPKRVLHRLRSSATSFNSQYHVFSLRFPVAAYVFFFVFPSFLSFPVSFLQ